MAGINKRYHREAYGGTGNATERYQKILTDNAKLTEENALLARIISQLKQQIITLEEEIKTLTIPNK